MNANLSPKDLAAIIGVSESSLKRWVDEGRLAAARTAGGHRRIALTDAVRFIRETHQPLVQPELLGMAELGGATTNGAASAPESVLLDALQAGRAQEARGLIIAQFLSSRSVAAVFDGPISHAMHRIGEIWKHSSDGIMIEHRATEICMDSVRQVRLLLPVVPHGAPVALGCAAPGDQHHLPSLMSATTLLEVGYKDINLGPDLPIESLISAIREHNPRIVWMSVSTGADRSAITPHIDRLAALVAKSGASLILGGRGVYALPPLNQPSTHIVGSMAELGAFARGLRNQNAAGSPHAARSTRPARAPDHAANK